ncbi:hypothetical protein [Parafrankia elaeagni]|uniref:hypothetical protein n=1 Tax=Parafrankia elaeagni TaxID=222534 RepID=UPI0012B664A6|nr:hypothetical protein [Parafrankia elaeagni]
MSSRVLFSTHTEDLTSSFFTGLPLTQSTYDNILAHEGSDKKVTEMESFPKNSDGATAGP